MTENLLPCPFCGGVNVVRGGDDKMVAVFCGTCGACGPDEYGASNNWNRRTPAPEGEDYASPVVSVGREDVEIVSEWLEMAKETPKPLHSSLNYVPVCASEIEAIERILAALGTKATDTGREG